MKKVGLMLAVLLALGGCGKTEEPAPAAVAAVPEPVVAPPPPVKKPQHRYSVKDGGEYGYQGELSQEEIDRGMAGNSLRMYTYLGERNGVHQVMLQAGEWRSVAECENPCTYVKLYTFYEAEFEGREIYALNPSMLISAVFEDAFNGFLEPRFGTRNGKTVQLWVDGDKKRLMHYPIE